MNRSEIIDSLSNWQAILNNNQDLIDVLGQGNSFIFELPNYISSSQYIHAYPGIYDDKLIFLLIPSEYDNSTYNANFDSYVTVCEIKDSASAPISSVVSTATVNRITATEAQGRMDKWDDIYDTWIPQQTATTDGIFQAFAIPLESFEVAESAVNLGLDSKSGITYTAELIVTNKTSTDVYYDNFARPVPPYSPSISQESFYLLSQA